MIKNDGFEQNCGHHELRHEKMMRFDPGVVDFRATSTHFVNILMFLLALEQKIASKIPREATYSLNEEFSGRQ